MLRRVGPDLDESLKIMVRDEIFALKDLHGSRTGVVAVFKPFLYTGSVVGDAGGQAHRRFHHVEGDRATE